MNGIFINFVKNNVMGTAELKKVLHSYIDQADDTFLKMVYAMSKEYKKSEIAGYTIDGSPITKKDLKNRVKAASKRVKGGHYTTQEEVEKEISN